VKPEAHTHRSPDDESRLDGTESRSARRARRAEGALGVALVALGIASTVTGTVLVAIVSRAGLGVGEVPGGFLSAIAIVVAGVAAIILGDAVRHGAPWARRLVFRRKR